MGIIVHLNRCKLFCTVRSFKEGMVDTPRSGHTGNPVRFACFLDESYNHKLAKCCRGAHAATFEKTVLSKFGIAFSGEGADAPQNSTDRQKTKKRPHTHI